MAGTTPLIAVVHDGRQGWASPQAYAARDGAAEVGARCVLVGSQGLGEPQWALLRAAGGILFGAELPGAAGRADWRGRPAAGFTDPRADPYDRLRELCAFAQGLGMDWLGTHVPPPPSPHAPLSVAQASLDSVRFLAARLVRAARTAG
ncbi:hypothetical protein [Streptomyces sp. NPDC090022]|uniref:hypothetical protein n=1 Tax=Streptomyces sp. NPDC090022 TaxID=3365920 RepID=UPI0038224CF1